MKRLLIAILTLACMHSVLGQARYLDEPVFQAGEKATYNIYFNLGFIWMQAGTVDFSCTDDEWDGKPCYKLMVSGKTQGTFERFYTVRDTFISYVDKETLRPIHYADHKHEDSYLYHSTFDYKDNGDSVAVHFWKEKKSSTSEMDFNIPKMAYDLVACCYNVRNVDATSLGRKDTVGFQLLFEDEVYGLGLKYQGKKTLKIKNGEKHRVMEFTPQVVSGDLFKNDEDLLVYVADDDNHYPIYVEAKLKMGKAVASLAKISGTKYERKSKVSK